MKRGIQDWKNKGKGKTDKRGGQRGKRTIRPLVGLTLQEAVKRNRRRLEAIEEWGREKNI